LEGGYDVTYAQQRAESQQLTTFAASVTQQNMQKQQKKDSWSTQQYGNDESTIDSYGQGDVYGDDSTVEYGGEAGRSSTQYLSLLNTPNFATVLDPWTMYYDDQGYPYYYNNITGASQYESPYQG
jgi:hypothetical protein